MQKKIRILLLRRLLSKQLADYDKHRVALLEKAMETKSDNDYLMYERIDAVYLFLRLELGYLGV